MTPAQTSARDAARAICRAILAAGGVSTVAAVAARSGLPPRVVSRRLIGHGPGAIRPEFQYYTHDGAGGWGLTARGRAAAEGQS